MQIFHLLTSIRKIIQIGQTVRADAFYVLIKCYDIAELFVDNITLKLQLLYIRLHMYPEIPPHVVWT